MVGIFFKAKISQKRLGQKFLGWDLPFRGASRKLSRRLILEGKERPKGLPALLLARNLMDLVIFWEKPSKEGKRGLILPDEDGRIVEQVYR